MITAACVICEKQFEVPSLRFQAYIMMNQIPCLQCQVDSGRGAYYTTSQYALDKHWASHLPIPD